MKVTLRPDSLSGCVSCHVISPSSCHSCLYAAIHLHHNSSLDAKQVLASCPRTSRTVSKLISFLYKVLSPGNFITVMENRLIHCANELGECALSPIFSTCSCFHLPTVIFKQSDSKCPENKLRPIVLAFEWGCLSVRQRHDEFRKLLGSYDKEFIAIIHKDLPN
jgi:hypothetical protein